MPSKTKISTVDVIEVDHHVLVQISAEDGESGFGQTALLGVPNVVAPIMDRFRPLLVGRDPDAIAALWQLLFRSSPARSASIMSAISAVDIALWDLKGRRHEVPVYELLGGRQRDKVRAHFVLGMTTWPETPTAVGLIEEAVQAVKDGFTAVKIDPLLTSGDVAFQDQSHLRRLTEAAQLVSDLRDAVGADVDVLVELHRKFDVAEAVAFADMIEPLGIYFLEDPLPPDSLTEWRRLADRVRVPLAAGERQNSLYEFADLLDAGIGDFMRPEIGTAGGLTQGVKIAALSEARHRRIVAHNFLSPLLTAATLQLYASVPNVGTFEWTPLEELEPNRSMVREPIQRDGGWLSIPSAPGIGVELDVAYLARAGETTPANFPPALTTAGGGIYVR